MPANGASLCGFVRVGQSAERGWIQLDSFEL